MAGGLERMAKKWKKIQMQRLCPDLGSLGYAGTGGELSPTSPEIEVWTQERSNPRTEIQLLAEDL